MGQLLPASQGRSERRRQPGTAPHVRQCRRPLRPGRVQRPLPLCLTRRALQPCQAARLTRRGGPSPPQGCQACGGLVAGTTCTVRARRIPPSLVGRARISAVGLAGRRERVARRLRGRATVRGRARPAAGAAAAAGTCAGRAGAHGLCAWPAAGRATALLELRGGARAQLGQQPQHHRRSEAWWCIQGLPRPLGSGRARRDRQAKLRCRAHMSNRLTLGSACAFATSRRSCYQCSMGARSCLLAEKPSAIRRQGARLQARMQDVCLPAAGPAFQALQRGLRRQARSGRPCAACSACSLGCTCGVRLRAPHGACCARGGAVHARPLAPVAACVMPNRCTWRDHTCPLTLTRQPMQRGGCSSAARPARGACCGCRTAHSVLPAPAHACAHWPFWPSCSTAQGSVSWRTASTRTPDGSAAASAAPRRTRLMQRRNARRSRASAAACSRSACHAPCAARARRASPPCWRCMLGAQHCCCTRWCRPPGGHRMRLLMSRWACEAAAWS